MSTHPDWTLAEHVDLMARRLASGQVDAELDAALELSYADLSGAAARLLRIFADLPVAELGADLVAVVLPDSAASASELLTELLDAGLVIGRDGGRVALHSLVRAYGRDRSELTDPPRQRRELFARVGWYLAGRVWAAYATLTHSMNDAPRRTSFAYPELEWTADEARDWLTAHAASSLTYALAAPERGEPELLFRLSEGMSWWLNLVGRQNDGLRLHEAAADLAAELGDADALAMASLDAGQLLLHGERPEEAQAHFHRATRLVGEAGELSDPGLAGVIDNMSALIDLRQGRIAEALASLRRAVALHAARGEDARRLSAMVNLGAVLHTAGDVDAEHEVLAEGLTSSRALGHALFEMYFLVNRAVWRAEHGDPDDALADAEEARAQASALGMPYLVVSADLAVAETLRRRGDLTEAAVRADQAVEAARRMGAEAVLAEVLVGQAEIAVDRGEQVLADACLDEAEGLLSTDGDRILRGHIWRLRARLAHDVEDRERFRQAALVQYRAAGSHHAELLGGG